MLKKALAVAMAAALTLGGAAWGGTDTIDIDVSDGPHWTGDRIDGKVLRVYSSTGEVKDSEMFPYSRSHAILGTDTIMIIGDNVTITPSEPPEPPIVEPGTGKPFTLGLDYIQTTTDTSNVFLVSAGESSTPGGGTGVTLTLNSLDMLAGGRFTITASDSERTVDMNNVTITKLRMGGEDTPAHLAVMDDSKLTVREFATITGSIMNRDERGGGGGLQLNGGFITFEDGLALVNSGLYASNFTPLPDNPGEPGDGTVPPSENASDLTVQGTKGIAMLGGSEIIAGQGAKLTLDASHITTTKGANWRDVNYIGIGLASGGSINAKDTDLRVESGMTLLRAGIDFVYDDAPGELPDDLSGNDITFKGLSFHRDATEDFSTAMLNITSSVGGQVVFTDDVHIRGLAGGAGDSEYAIVNVIPQASNPQLDDEEVVPTPTTVWKKDATVGKNGIITNLVAFPYEQTWDYEVTVFREAELPVVKMSESVVDLHGNLNLTGGSLIHPHAGDITFVRPDDVPTGGKLTVTGRGNLILGVRLEKETESPLVMPSVNADAFDLTIAQLDHHPGACAAGDWNLAIVDTGLRVGNADLVSGELVLAQGWLHTDDEFLGIGTPYYASLYDVGFVIRSENGAILVDPDKVDTQLYLAANSHIITELRPGEIEQGYDFEAFGNAMERFIGDELFEDAEFVPITPDFPRDDLVYPSASGRGLLIEGYDRVNIVGAITVGGGWGVLPVSPGADPGEKQKLTVLANRVMIGGANEVKFYYGASINLSGTLAMALFEANPDDSTVFDGPGLANTLVTSARGTLASFKTCSTARYQNSMFGQFTNDLAEDLPGPTSPPNIPDSPDEIKRDAIYVSSAANNKFRALLTLNDRRDLAHFNLNQAWGIRLRSDFTDIVWDAVGEELVTGDSIEALDAAGLFNLNNFAAIAAGTPANFVDESTFKYLLGGYAGDIVEIGINSVRTQNEQVHKRTGVVRGQMQAFKNLSSTEGYAASIMNQNFANRVWAGTFGQWEKADRHKGLQGYKYNAWGLNVGYDRFICSNFVVGAAFTYSSGDYKDRSAYAHDSDVDNYAVNVYGTYSAANGVWVDLFGGFTYSDDDINELRRFGSGTGSELAWAKADFHTNIWNIGSTVGYDWKPTANFILTPSLGLNYIHAKASDHTSTVTGYPAETQRVSGVDNWALLLPVEVAARYDICFGNDSKLSLGGRVGYTYNFNDDSADGRVRYFGTPDLLSARTLCREASRHTLTLGADVRYSVNRFDVGVQYDYYKQSDWRAHRVMGTVGLSF